MCDFLENIFNYILYNTKDFVNICFWLFMGSIAYFTYKNAKKTLFNPIRSEMVKYQMKSITEFIDKHTSKGYDLDTSIDYSNLLKLNYETDYLFDILTNDANFENHLFDELVKERLSFCEKNLGGLFEIRINDNNLNLESVSGDFETTKKYVQTNYIKEKEELFKHLFLQRFYITKRFNEVYTDLINLQQNPFIPEEIKTEVSTIIKNIYINIGELYKLLTIHIKEQTGTTYQIVYSQFYETKIDHKKDLNNLRLSITNYFKVNNYS